MENDHKMIEIYFKTIDQDKKSTLQIHPKEPLLRFLFSFYDFLQKKFSKESLSL